MSTPAVLVRAPRPKPPQLSLLASSIKGDTTPIDENTPADAWVNGITYRPHNHYAAELRGVCHFDVVDLPALATPGQPTAVGAAGGGTLVAATYGYRVSAINANGETLASTERTVVLGATGHVTVTWNRVHNATGYKVYGRTAGSELLLATVPDNPEDVGGTISFVDDGSLTPSGALPAGNTTGGTGSYGNLAPPVYRPFFIVVEDSCSAMQWQMIQADKDDRAKLLLDNATPQAIEREFWTGSLSAALGFTENNFLANPGSVTDLTPGSGPPSVKRGMQILEDALFSCGYGGQGMIHAQPQTAPDLTGARRVGNLLLTAMDTIIVPGSGYQGTGPNNVAPAAGTSWLYATDLVATWLDPALDEIIPEDEFALDRDVNLIRYRAMRPAAATFDGACHFACRVTLAT